jgi:hypothetical protein
MSYRRILARIDWSILPGARSSANAPGAPSATKEILPTSMNSLSNRLPCRQESVYERTLKPTANALPSGGHPWGIQIHLCRARLQSRTPTPYSRGAALGVISGLPTPLRRGGGYTPLPNQTCRRRRLDLITSSSRIASPENSRGPDSSSRFPRWNSLSVPPPPHGAAAGSHS